MGLIKFPKFLKQIAKCDISARGLDFHLSGEFGRQAEPYYLARARFPRACAFFLRHMLRLSTSRQQGIER